MKFILFNLNDTNKNYINNIRLDNNHYINEVSLSKTKLEELQEEPSKWFRKLKRIVIDKDINRKILKALEGHNKKWYYILSKDIGYNKYLANKAESLLGYKLNVTNELDVNIFKYIDEHLEKNKSLKKHELKILLVSNINENINFTLLNNLIKEYKSVNIYLKEKPSTYTLKRIKQINRTQGTTIDVVKRERKVFTEYNVIYFVDDVKGTYPRFRLNKQALTLDLSTSEQDKFNFSMLFFKEYILKGNVLKDNIERLMKEYKLLELANVIGKITNELDKL